MQSLHPCKEEEKAVERKEGRRFALLRVLGGLLLGLAVVVGLLYFLVAVNFSQNLVESETYVIAISDTDAYNRIYREVLADPEVRDHIRNLMGDVDFDEVAEVIEVLQEVMPPSYLQAQTEDNINRFTGFLRDEREELEIYARLRLPLERVESAVLGKVHQYIDELEIREPPSQGCSVEHLQQMAEAFAVPLSQLSGGQIPESAPSLEILTQECREREYDHWFDLLLDNAAMDSQTKEILEIESPNLRRDFMEGDTRAFLTTVADPLAAPLIEEAVADIRRNLQRSDRFDLLDWLADASEDTSRRDIHEQAESLRNVVSAVNGLGRVIGLAIVIVGLLLMSLTNLPRTAQMLRWPGITLAMGGGVCLLAGFMLNSVFPGQIRNAILDATYYYTDVPVSALNLAADLGESFGEHTTTGFLSATAAVIVIGGVLIVASLFSGALTGAVRRILPRSGGRGGSREQRTVATPLSESEFAGPGDSQDVCPSDESSNPDSDRE